MQDIRGNVNSLGRDINTVVLKRAIFYRAKLYVHIISNTFTSLSISALILAETISTKRDIKERSN